SHSSPYVNGTTQQHQAQFAASPILVPSGATLTQWVNFQAGVNAPSEIMVQLHTLDGSSWEHRAYWGASLIGFGTNGTASRRQHQTSTFAYDRYNDQVASVDPSGIAKVTDYDPNGLARQVLSGLHAPTPPVVFEDPLQYNGVLANPWVFEKLTNNTIQPSTVS